MEIRTLPDFLINQIAAGEVIERPAFIIKELLENAIDAKATEINIIVKDGGRKEIIVSDNGIGMTSDQLKLSIKRHATSKLPKNNLNDINFLGFRGEALPSIASISELKIESCRKKLDQGWCIELKNNNTIKFSPSPIKIGTKIIVNNIFENVPARLKFLKSNQVENKNSLQIIKKIALGHPEIKFLYKFEENLSHVYKKENLNTGGFKERILEVFQDDFLPNSLLVENEIKSDLGGIPCTPFSPYAIWYGRKSIARSPVLKSLSPSLKPSIIKSSGPTRAEIGLYWLAFLRCIFTALFASAISNLLVSNKVPSSKYTA